MRSSLEGEGAPTDSLISVAARALAVGDVLGALNCVALRDDAPALALRGIAMARLGDLERAKALRRAARAFGSNEAVARARCVVAEAEIALVSRDIERTWLADTKAAPLASAVPASIGVAAGALVFDPKRAAQWAAQGREVILARPDIGTEDIDGIAAAQGVLTAAGGRTSHAAVVARQFGKVCLVACTALRIEADGASCYIGAERLSEGAELTLEAKEGRVYRGRLSVVHERPEKALAEVAGWRRTASVAS